MASSEEALRRLDRWRISRSDVCGNLWSPNGIELLPPVTVLDVSKDCLVLCSAEEFETIEFDLRKAEFNVGTELNGAHGRSTLDILFADGRQLTLVEPCRGRPDRR